MARRRVDIMLCNLWYWNKTKVSEKNTLQFKQNLRQVDCYVNAGENSWVKVADDDAVDACYQNEKPSQTMTCKMTDCPNSRKYYTEGAGAKK